jgi:hypothetical protein|tara:strand:- start:12 stop:185 length:174 start_codon:yes stop_codon:yes gene_type:complete
MMDQEPIVYATQEGKDDPIYINILRREKDFERIKISKTQAMRLVVEITQMLQLHIKD